MEAKKETQESWFSRFKQRRRKSLDNVPQQSTGGGDDEDFAAVSKRRQSASAIVLPKIELDKLLPSPVIGFSDDEDENDDNDDQSSNTSTPGSASGSSSSGRGGSGGSGRFGSDGRSASGGRLSSFRKSPMAVVSIGLDPMKPHAAIQNTERAGRKYDRRIKKGPIPRDGPGFLFARRYVGDPGGDLYCEIGVAAEKVSTTTTTTEGELFMSFPDSVWWPVQRRMFCKSLVYLLLDAMRVHRYAVRKHDRTGHDMCVSVNKNTRAIIQDKVWSFYELSATETMPILATRPVFKNWFMISPDVAAEVVEKVVVAINGHWPKEN